MTKHLDDHQITAAVAGLELEVAAAEHLQSCLSCRQQVSAMRDLIDGQRQQLEDEAPNWDRQRQEIMLRLPTIPARQATPRRVWTRPLLAVAAVLIAAIGVRALWLPAPAGDSIGPPEIPVEQILAEVDALLADDTIPGFERIDPEIDEEIFENGES
jgi:predicted anti-sigma-YlaC factor YlaD